jgi:hypothetical protein
MVRPVSATRRRLPGGSFIWPYTIATFDFSELLDVDDAGFLHLVVEVVAFAGTLTHAGEHRQAAVLALAMLLISSIMLTVLPTPAPPNRPTLPPLANGHIRSITLMPVSSRSVAEDWSS